MEFFSHSRIPKKFEQRKGLLNFDEKTSLRNPAYRRPPSDRLQHSRNILRSIRRLRAIFDGGIQSRSVVGSGGFLRNDRFEHAGANPVHEL